jgi:hypothetical protein
MKPASYIFIIWILIVIISILWFLNTTPTTKEPFLSGFNKMYRPYVRNARLYTSNKINSFTSKSKVFFRRIGIL